MRSNGRCHRFRMLQPEFLLVVMHQVSTCPCHASPYRTRQGQAWHLHLFGRVSEPEDDCPGAHLLLLTPPSWGGVMLLRLFSNQYSHVSARGSGQESLEKDLQASAQQLIKPILPVARKSYKSVAC